MTVYVEGKHAFYLGSRAVILDGSYEKAWAEKYIVHNKAHSYILGKFVEADRANNNKQYFQMAGLRMGQPTIAHSPMNIDHTPKKFVGSYVASDFVYPTEAADAVGANPYIEALGVFWKAHFPEEWAKVQDAHNQGHLFFSMECVPEKIGCIGEQGCGQVFAYDGQQSSSYCAHLNDRVSEKDLINPHFTAGAILLPPVKPGWTDANIHSLVALEAASADRVYEGIAEEMEGAESSEWEQLMDQFLGLAGFLVTPSSSVN